jgi:hypothetical protein
LGPRPGWRTDLRRGRGWRRPMRPKPHHSIPTLKGGLRTKPQLIPPQPENKSMTVHGFVSRLLWLAITQFPAQSPLELRRLPRLALPHDGKGTAKHRVAGKHLPRWRERQPWRSAQGHREDRLGGPGGAGGAVRRWRGRPAPRLTKGAEVYCEDRLTLGRGPAATVKPRGAQPRGVGGTAHGRSEGGSPRYNHAMNSPQCRLMTS